MSGVSSGYEQNLGNGVIREWLANQQVLILSIYHNEDRERFTLDMWFNTLIETRQTWPHDKPYRVIHDFTHFPFNTRAAHRAYEMSRQFPPYLKGRIGLVVNGENEDVTDVAGLAINIFSNIQPEVGIKQFFARKAALDWVLAYR